MKKELKILYAEVQEHYKALLPLIARLEELAIQDAAPHEHADTEYCIRQVETTYDDIKKRLNRLSSFACKAANLLALGQNKTTIRTEYCTATCTSREWIKIPYKRSSNEKEFDELMKFIYVNGPAAKLELVRFHPPNFIDYLTERLHEGRKLPEFLNLKERTTEFKLTIRKKKGVLE